MAPVYKVTYFNMVGLAEPIKYLLAYGNLPFEEVRVAFEDWPKFREESTPFGKLPMLEVNGKVYYQSSAICRYLSKQLGLYGKTDDDAYQADSIVDTIVDYFPNIAKLVRAEGTSAKAEILAELKSMQTPYYFERLDKIVAENGGNFVKGQLTWADFFLSAIADRLSNAFNETFLAPYPNLTKLKQKVDNLPGVKEYLSTRSEGIKF